jgi:hypothetical protein
VEPANAAPALSGELSHRLRYRTAGFKGTPGRSRQREDGRKRREDLSGRERKGALGETWSVCEDSGPAATAVRSAYRRQWESSRGRGFTGPYHGVWVHGFMLGSVVYLFYISLKKNLFCRAPRFCHQIFLSIKKHDLPEIGENVNFSLCPESNLIIT